MIAQPRLPGLARLVAARLPAEAWLGRPLTWLGLAIDATVVQAMRVVVDRALMPDADALARMLAAAEPYATEALARDPASFFAFEPATLVPARVATRERHAIAGGAVLRHRLEASLRPWAGPPWPDDAIRVEHWAHRRRPRAVVLALHGFVMGNPAIDSRVLFAGSWFRRGYDVALLTLPYHGRRTPGGARFSGERFAAADPAALNEAVRRAIWEIRLVAGWLRTRTDAEVGLLGLSLGGYLAALAAGLVDDLAFVVPMVPPVCFGDLAWRFYRASRQQGAAPALTLDQLRRAYRVHSPLSHALRMPPERVLIVAGRGDRIVPCEHPHALWRHWGEPPIHWFSGGHLTPFGRRTIVEAVDRHLGRLPLG